MTRLTKEIKEEVMRLAKGKCERCGEIEPKMEFHHRNYNPKDNHFGNIDYLCKFCHKRVHLILRRSTYGFKNSGNVTRLRNEHSFRHPIMQDKLTLSSYLHSTTSKDNINYGCRYNDYLIKKNDFIKKLKEV